MQTSDRDQYFMESLKEGDEKGITAIYTKLYPKIKKYVYAHDGYEDDARDIMQKALLQLSVRVQAPDFYIQNSFEGYFFTICKNLWRRTAKIAKTRVTNDDEVSLIHDERDIALATFEQEKWELFEEKLLEISENCRKLLRLFFDKIPYATIVTSLRYGSDNTVRQRIFKCKSKLKEAIHTDARYLELKEL